MTQISGYATIYNFVDSDRDVIIKGSLSNANDEFYLYWQHDLNHRVGKINSLYDDERGIFIKAEIFNHHPNSHAISKAIREHKVTGLSIGFKPLATKLVKSKKIRIIKQLKLFEISIVTFPANELSQIRSISF